MWRALTQRDKPLESTDQNKVMQKERETVESKRKEMFHKMLELEEELRKGKKEREGALIKRKHGEISSMEARISKITKALAKEKVHKQKLDNSKLTLADADVDFDSSDEELEIPKRETGQIMSSSKKDKQQKVKISPSEVPIEKFDILVSKLEKLDKLDELLKKLNNMSTMMPLPESEGRTYADLKKEMEELQKIIFDDKTSDKDREDANIKFEKIFIELQQTSEYKQELEKMNDDKRKLNEPLNKEALEKMMKKYSAENLRKDEELQEKLRTSPELQLIGMDPKLILSKHQNDFAQYFLRGLELDELRGILASLPKFRKDQKKQKEWVDQLESKIEQLAKQPAKAKPPKKNPSLKPPAPPLPKKLQQMKKIQVVQQGPDNEAASGIFAELLAKRKRND